MSRVKTIKYERVFGLGNFENEKIGVEMEVVYKEGDDIDIMAEETFKAAKQFVLTNSTTYKEKIVAFSDMMMNSNITVGQRAATIRNAKIYMTPADYAEFEKNFLNNNL